MCVCDTNNNTVYIKYVTIHIEKKMKALCDSTTNSDSVFRLFGKFSTLSLIYIYIFLHEVEGIQKPSVI